MKTIILVILCVLFGAARFFITPSPLDLAGSYQAFAHLFVGGLFGAWLACRKQKIYLILALGMSLLEIVAATISRI